MASVLKLRAVIKFSEQDLFFCHSPLGSCDYGWYLVEAGEVRGWMGAGWVLDGAGCGWMGLCAAAGVAGPLGPWAAAWCWRAGKWPEPLSRSAAQPPSRPAAHTPAGHPGARLPARRLPALGARDAQPVHPQVGRRRGAACWAARHLALHLLPRPAPRCPRCPAPGAHGSAAPLAPAAPPASRCPRGVTTGASSRPSRTCRRT
jgi:hypothetical protein